MNPQLLDPTPVALKKSETIPSGSKKNDDYLHKFLNRTGKILNEEALGALRKARILIAGCGGVGGAVALTMARLGVEHFTVADPGRFDEPDVNRQWAADTSTLGLNKAAVYADRLRRINPDLRVRLHPEGVHWKNVDALVADADLVIDCLDVSVDGLLRARMFRRAEEKGIHAITAPVLGFGAFVVIASPNGMSMDPMLEFLNDPSGIPKLPPLFRSFYSSSCIEAMERDMASGKLPSISIGPVLTGALVSTEALLILTKGHLTPWREPVCLPNVLMMDSFTGRFQVIKISELFKDDSNTGEEVNEPSRNLGNECLNLERIKADRLKRLSLLRSVSLNTNLLPSNRIELDLLTDSWGEIEAAPEIETSKNRPGDCDGRFRELYGYPHVLSVTRGRFAEALLANAVVKPGSIAIGNGLFPSTRFHIESRGAKLLQLNADHGMSGALLVPFRADLDLEQLDRLLAAREQQPVSCVWLDTCANAVGGAPLSLTNLKAVYARCSAAGVPVILDATRLLENIHLCREMEPELGEMDPQRLLYEFTRHSDACAMSAMKDFRVKKGGFVACHSEELFFKVRDLLLAFGNGLTDEHKILLHEAMQGDPLRAAQKRVELVKNLHEQLLDHGLPILGSRGGHGVFVDVSRLLPHLKPEEYPVQALTNALFVEYGIRGGEHFYTAQQKDQGELLLRLAWPLSLYGDAAVKRLVLALDHIQKNPQEIKGLRKVFQPQGALGAFLTRYEPLNPKEKK